MYDYNLRLAFIDGEPNFVEDHTRPGAEDFTFALKRKDELFGECRFEQWWMDIRSIYRIRNSAAINYDPLINFWWRSCVENRTNRDAGVCESYVLAKSLEFTRTNGSRNVFADSMLRRENRRLRQEIESNLEKMLRSSDGEEMSILKFSRQTGDFLGPPEYDEEVFHRKDEFEGELFARTVPDLQQGSAVNVAEAVSELWEQWCQRARRRKAETEKQVVDIMSYESKAALHQCYSHFWVIATLLLAEIRECSDTSIVFHRFWHTDLIWPSNEFEDRSFHLFHGHVLALHPGTFFFSRTETGKRLIGEWLTVASIDWQYAGDPETPELRRLLHGLSVAMLDYINKLETSRSLRRRT